MFQNDRIKFPSSGVGGVIWVYRWSQVHQTGATNSREEPVTYGDLRCWEEGSRPSGRDMACNLSAWTRWEGKEFNSQALCYETEQILFEK